MYDVRARRACRLVGVGFCASMIGVGVTNALLGVRQMLDPTFKPVNTAQDVVSTSLAYGVYMSVSSNLRYQVRAGACGGRMQGGGGGG